jgi:hypothetical protein
MLKEHRIFRAALDYKLPEVFQNFVFELRIFVLWIFTKFLQAVEVVHI